MFTNTFARSLTAYALAGLMGLSTYALADPITLHTGNDSVHGFKEWSEDKGGFRITSEVQQLGGGRWEYSYHITSNMEEGSGYSDLGEQMHHFWLEVSPGFELDEIIIPGTLSDLDDIDSYGLTGGPNGTVLLEVDENTFQPMHGIEFILEPEAGSSWWFSFESYRPPVLGDFYAHNLCHQEFADMTTAYNWGFIDEECTEETCIWVPDSAVVPEPSTYAMLGLLLTLTFFFQRQRKRHTA